LFFLKPENLTQADGDKSRGKRQLHFEITGVISQSRKMGVKIQLDLATGVETQLP
jgi:hypothetical protein